MASAKPVNKKPRKVKQSEDQTTAAIHAKHVDGEHHAVLVLNLHVMIVPDGKYWFAQGLEIDYAVQGQSVADAKKQFETGFKATIYQHLKVFGHINNMLRVAPNEVWREFWKTPKSQKVYTHASMHEIVPGSKKYQFDIEFQELQAA